MTMDFILKPHIEATAARMAQHPVVLAVQDTTSLNYSAHPATQGLGPINTRADGAVGLKLHDTLVFSPEGIPLGILDAECWAREEMAPRSSNRDGLAASEALRWLVGCSSKGCLSSWFAGSYSWFLEKICGRDQGLR